MIAGIIAGLKVALVSSISKIIVASLSEKALTRVFIGVAEKLSESTDNTIDDQWVKDTKEKLNL